MVYQKLSEYQAKTLYYKYIRSNKLIHYLNNDKLDLDYDGSDLVVKVDDGSKRRMKRGLVKINLNKKEIEEWILSRSKEYDNNYVVEKSSNIKEEVYMALRLSDNGIEIIINKNGGINLDDPEKDGTLIKVGLDENSDSIYQKLDDMHDNLKKVIFNLYGFFIKYHFVFLEVNPLGLVDNEYIPLDFAILRDSCSDFLMDKNDIEILNMNYLPDEKLDDSENKIKELDSRTGGSLKFTLLNKNGSIWTLIAGGGASVVYTDAIINSGHGDDLGNYGEYSGNPQEELVEEYCNIVFDKILKSGNDMNKIKLFIGGGIANFTNVANTFKGIVRALEKTIEINNEFSKINIFVRRGGPNYQEGLDNFKKVFHKYGMNYELNGPEDDITGIVKRHLVKKEYSNNNINDGLDNLNLLKDNMIKKLNFNNEMKCIIVGQQIKACQRMLDFDYLSGNDISILCIYDPMMSADKNIPLLFGKKNILMKCYKNLNDIILNYGNKINFVINFASFRSSYNISLNTINKMQIDNMVVIAEGIPEHNSLRLKIKCDELGTRLIGPSTVGGIIAGKFRIGNTGGSIDNIQNCRLDSKGGSVAYVSRSGGLLNELSWIVSHKTSGVNMGISIGGDRYSGTNFIDYVMEYENNDKIKMIIILGEVGGIQEILIGDAKRKGLIKKPIIGWCMGTSAEFINNKYGNNIQFGHAGASANSNYESAKFKNQYMRSSGIIVPDSFENLSIVIEREYLKADPNFRRNIFYEKKVIGDRKLKPFYSSISNENKEELEYNGIKISEFSKMNNGIGKVIGNLWLKKDLPEHIAKYIELILIITADHGAMVSGAHNTIVTSRAGKDMVSSLCSGLLTIGDRFGGALNKACKQFYNANKEKLTPMEFVKSQKSKGELIYGIGHKVKSIDNPDIRVKILKEYFINNFEGELVNYALEVEQITTKKKNNLILNVDGFIAVSLIDCLKEVMESKDIEEIIDNELMNAFFVLGRTIGFIGHWYDQKRLKQGLFRLNKDDIEYI